MNRLLKFVILLFLFSASYLQVKSQRQIYAVIVGVSDYKNDNLQLDLNYCDDDARSFYNLLRNSGVKQENMSLLTDYSANKKNIINKLNFIFSKADKDDEVIFFFSGHGDKGSFLPCDFNGNYNSVLDHSDVKASFKKCKANKKICIADACYSGSIKRPSTKSKSKTSSIDKESGIVVIMSSRDYQTSREMPSLKNGAFTYYLVKGLKGYADKNNDKIITVSEMYYYTRDKVKLETLDKQMPIIFGNFDKNMPILYLN
jgi:uncharacterized caspase-like protein